MAEELCGGGDLSELLKELDEEPLGTASIAQASNTFSRLNALACLACGKVHRAVLNDGREASLFLGQTSAFAMIA